LIQFNNMPKINLKNVVWKEGEYYVAQCLNVDVSSFGKTKKEALANLDEALDLYFEDSTENKTEIKNIIKIERPELVPRSLSYV